MMTLSGGMEDWLCILIIAFPFLFFAGIIGLIASYIVKKKNTNKMFSIIFIPILLVPVEQHFFHNKEQSYTVEKK